MSNVNLISFFDSSERTLFAEFVEDKGDSIVVANPVVVQVSPQLDQSGRPTQSMALQLLPIFFKEFLAVPDDKVQVEYRKDRISMVTIPNGFDVKLYQNYMQIFGPRVASFQPSQVAPQQAPQSPINLFDGDDTDNPNPFVGD